MPNQHAFAQHKPISPNSPRDLADFLLNWNKFRPAMTALQDKKAITKADSETLGWMVALIDRLRADDIA